MIRVLYDYKIWSKQRYGGISRYYYEIIKRNTENFSVMADVCAGFFYNDYGLDKLSNRCLKVFGTKLSEAPKNKMIKKFVNATNITFFSSWMVLQGSQYDVYHPTYYAKGNRRFKGRQVVTVYDMVHELYPHLFSEEDPTSQAKRRTVEQSDWIITISETTKRDLVNIFDIDPYKIQVIHLANSLLYKASEEEEAILNKPYILFVGNRKGYKNFSNFIRAYTNSSKLSKDFCIVAFGGETLTNEEKNLFEELKINDRVHHLYGDDRIANNLYKNAACLIYPSFYEGFGIPPLEAMYHGCPVVASNVSSIPEVVGDAAFLFSPGDNEEMLYALEKVLYDEVLKSSLRKKGYQREKNFSWDRCAQETFHVYQRLSV